uniref:Uncharacterized protein n=1 Tax=Pristionchus pacificus TaxID=54126 RepID=A0A2A6CTW4_PRIPA|eukprot:PDM81625.1 hypothetical protein PRIPAC_30606 [Pristionchus pacificus]
MMKKNKCSFAARLLYKKPKFLCQRERCLKSSSSNSYHIVPLTLCLTILLNLNR